MSYEEPCLRMMIAHSMHGRARGQTYVRCWDRIVNLCEGKDRDGRASVRNDIGGAYWSSKT